MVTFNKIKEKAMLLYTAWTASQPQICIMANEVHTVSEKVRVWKEDVVVYFKVVPRL
jgi:hypothetical protein